MTLFLLSIPSVNWLSVIIDDFKFYSESIFAHDLWISSDIAFLTIPCVIHSLMMLIPYVGCHLVFIGGFKIYSDYVFADDL